MAGVANATRTWLMSQPRPARLRVTIAGQAEPTVVDVPPNVSWIALAESIDALKPTTVEALDADGKLLRARDPSQAAEHAAQVVADEPTRTFQNDNAIVVFAKLLADAYKHSTTVAFDKLLDLVNAINRRAEVQERTVDHLQKVLRRITEQQLEAVQEQAGQGTLAEQMMQAFMSGQQVAPAAAEHTNGNGTNGAAGFDPRTLQQFVEWLRTQQKPPQAPEEE